MLIDDVADADGRDHFEEVGSQASVQTGGALVLEDLLEQARHGDPGVAIARRWKDRKKQFTIRL